MMPCCTDPFLVTTDMRNAASDGREWPEPKDPEEAAHVLCENVGRINQVLEGVVRKEPEQWVWAHRRFRTRPPGEPSLYPERGGALRRFRRWVRARG